MENYSTAKSSWNTMQCRAKFAFKYRIYVITEQKKKGKGNAFWNTAHVGLPYLALVESIFIESGKMNFTGRLFLLRCHHVCYP